MNNGQVMLMDDFLSEEEQLLMAQGFEMDEDDENRYYFDQDGNLSNIFKKAFSAIDKGLAKFDRTVIQPAGRAIVPIAKMAAWPAGDKDLRGIAQGFLTGVPPNMEQLKNIVGKITGKPPMPGESLGSMVGGSPQMLDFLRQRTAVNVPASTPDLIPEAQEIAQSMDMLKDFMANTAGVPGPNSLPPLPRNPPPSQQMKPSGIDVGSILKNPIVLGVGGLVLLKVLKVF
jgi:hypothetical protein